MPKYLFTATYSQTGMKGLLEEGGTKRVAALSEAVTSAGGTIEAAYFAFGGADVYVIADLPDAATAAALASAARASGAVINGQTVVLLTAADMDEAAHKSVTYRPPGA